MLNVYDKSYERIGYIESYSYLSWVRRYSQSGEFELRCAPENLPLLALGHILAKAGDNEGVVIETIAVETVEQDTVIVRGRFLSALLESRIIWETESLHGDIGDCIGLLLDNNAICPADADRAIPRLAYEKVLLGREIALQVSFKNLLETVTGIVSEAGIGLKGELKNSKTTISLYQGQEQPFVFSREYENLLSQSYTDSIKDAANIAKVAGEGEGAARQVLVVGETAGIDRREIFVDAKDLRASEYEDQEQYFAALALRGQEKLFARRPRESFEAAANTNSNLTYRVDFDLGDIVTVKSSLQGLSRRLRITEVVETYDAEGLHVDLVFGDPLPTLGERLKGVI